MNSGVAQQVRHIERSVTAFLDEWTARTKRRHQLGDSLADLTRITSDSRMRYEELAARLAELEAWLDRHGEAVVDEGVQRADLEVLVAAAEGLVALRARHETDFSSGEQIRLTETVDRIVALIRRGTSALGLEYTPAGLVEAPPAQAAESRRTRRSLLERLQGFEDVKAAYRKALAFQHERLDYFYQADTHLLTVLDYQLKNLEARPNQDDEFFAACLVYFLHQHNYQVKPYLQRFRAVAGREDRASLWAEDR